MYGCLLNPVPRHWPEVVRGAEVKPGPRTTTRGRTMGAKDGGRPGRDVSGSNNIFLSLSLVSIQCYANAA